MRWVGASADSRALVFWGHGELAYSGLSEPGTPGRAAG